MENNDEKHITNDMNWYNADMIILHHGSPQIVERPCFGLGNPSNDYGLGFYCTLEQEAAKLWASRSVNGFVNSYRINAKGLRILDLTKEEFSALHWLSLLLRHRRLEPRFADHHQTLLRDLFAKYPVSLEGYDAVVGYRADDRYFRYCKDFLSNALDYGSLTRALSLGKLGLQYVLISPEAFARLSFIEAQRIGEEWLDAYQKKMRSVDEEYDEVLRNVDHVNGVFLRDLLYDRH